MQMELLELDKQAAVTVALHREVSQVVTLLLIQVQAAAAAAALLVLAVMALQVL
jgi:hypothetical protein